MRELVAAHLIVSMRGFRLSCLKHGARTRRISVLAGECVAQGDEEFFMLAVRHLGGWVRQVAVP